MRPKLLTSLLALALAYAPGIDAQKTTGLTDQVAWDDKSLFIKGQRTFILSAEVHPWRLPGNPDLWADIFQKVKSNGFNTVSFYTHWASHYPESTTNGGEGDFQEGTYRDVQRFIDEAKKAGLWLIARPGPYINGETTGGGFPGWVGNIAGALRTNNANYKAAWTPYMTAISKIIAKNQITNGGPIILVQAENEFSASTANNIYMQDIIDLYRANGIVVPLTHNDQHSGQAGNFSPDKPGTHVDIYCGDSYPQGTSRWAQVQAIYYSAHKASAPSNPLCLAEFGGGYLLGWGAVARGGTGYEKYSNDLSNATFENVFYKDAYAQTATIFNIYMLFGGTNWGNTVEPTVYSSYDYGGGINENRVALTKMNEMRLQGNFLRVSRDLLGSIQIANGTNYTTNNLVYTTELRNQVTNGAFYVLRQNTSTSTSLVTTQLNIRTSRGSITVPQTGNLTFNGRESKILVTDYVFGKSSTSMLYSTAEIMTWTTIDDTDCVVQYAPEGQTGETALLLAENPTVFAPPSVRSTYANGTLTLDYTLGSNQVVRIQSGSAKIALLLLSKATANNWHAPLIAGPGTFGNYFSIGTNQTVLVGGPYIVRDASIDGPNLALTGDLNGTTTLQIVAPSSVKRFTWNGRSVSVSQDASGFLSASLGGANAFSLPTLSNWKVSGSLPEIDPAFDDSSMTTADQTTTNYTNLPVLAGDKVLYSQQYGFYGGNLIFRGHFNATGQETAITTTVQYGFAGGYSAWFNGIFLGSSQGNSSVSLSTDTWSLPADSLKVGQDNVFVIIQDHTGIVETSTSSGKEPRGIRGYAIVGGNTTFSQWKMQGNLGGASATPDTFRGYLNEGGLYAERIGAHLPGFPDSSWADGTPLTGGGVAGAGINFYRTEFDLAIPDGVDAPIRLQITPSDISLNFRVLVYINGWQVGKYINNIGPQTVFVLPAGILRRKSKNTLALALWSLDSKGAAIAGLSLISDGTFSTSLPLDDYASPDYDEQRKSRPEPAFAKPM